MPFEDLKSRNLIVFKGVLFLCLGLASGGLVVIEGDSWWKRLALLGVCIWAFCRVYYFAFYVLRHYVDPDYRYSGLISALRYLSRRRSGSKPRSETEDHKAVR